MWGEQIFLIDSNTLIDPYRRYYSFNFVPGFWSFIKDKIVENRVVILDKVYDELVIKRKSDDAYTDLSKWLLDIKMCPQVKHNDSSISEMY